MCMLFFTGAQINPHAAGANLCCTAMHVHAQSLHISQHMHSRSC